MKGTYRDLVGSYVSATGAELVIKSMISSRVVKFPAFLTNLSDDFKSSWNTEQVYGRMDPLASFQHTTRTVQLGFNVPSASVKEAKNNHKKFSTFSQMLYPAYLRSSDLPPPTDGETSNRNAGDNTLTMAKSPLVRVKFGNLIKSQDGTKGLLGWIDGISYKPTLSLGFFAEGGGQFYAKNYELTFTLNVLHDEDIGIDSINGSWLDGNNEFPF